MPRRRRKRRRRLSSRPEAGAERQKALTDRLAVAREKLPRYAELERAMLAAEERGSALNRAASRLEQMQALAQSLTERRGKLEEERESLRGTGEKLARTEAALAEQDRQLEHLAAAHRLWKAAAGAETSSPPPARPTWTPGPPMSRSARAMSGFTRPIWMPRPVCWRGHSGRGSPARYAVPGAIRFRPGCPSTPPPSSSSALPRSR